MEHILINAQNAQPFSNEGHNLSVLNLSIATDNTVFLVGLKPALVKPYLLMLSGQHQPEQGEVALLGKQSAHYNKSERLLLHKELALVIEGGALLSALSGLDNLKLAARYHKVGTEQQINEKAQALLAKMPYKSQLTSLPAQMNIVLHRQLEIARPLMLDPKVLFIDNPFVGLGYYDAKIIASYISWVNQNIDVTLVIACDDLLYTRQLADKIVFCDANEARVFDGWDSFYECDQQSIDLMFKLQRIKRNVKTS